MKTSELIGDDLNTWTARARGWELTDTPGGRYWIDNSERTGGGALICLCSRYLPSTDDAQAMALVVEFGISPRRFEHKNGVHCGEYWLSYWTGLYDSMHYSKFIEGKTAGISICRAFIASVYGEDVPDE